MKQDPPFHRQSHPLARGIYTARYVVRNSQNQLAMVESDMLVTSESDWRLLAAWKVSPGARTEVPITGWIVPPDCQFQILRVAKQPIIVISMPAFFDRADEPAAEPS